MYTLLFFLSFSLMVFKNSLYFTMVLLVFSIMSLMYMVWLGCLSSLTSFMLVIVYVGAMMVLIGYICAVSPNLNLEPDYTNLMFSLIALPPCFFMSFFSAPAFYDRTTTLTDYFYSMSGVLVFLSLVFMLFITLLMVTSQYSISQTPLRSFS